jgi:hypothetical protein
VVTRDKRSLQKILSKLLMTLLNGSNPMLLHTIPTTLRVIRAVQIQRYSNSYITMELKAVRH